MLNIWGLTDIGLVRKENQDTYGIRFNEESGHTICVVCDGMGGAKGGALASLLASETFLSSCMGNLHSGMDREGVEKVAEFAISAANGAVYERSVENAALRGMGTTLVSAIVKDGRVLLNNVGDSRAYLISSQSDTPIRRITKDHSWVEKMVDMGNITAEEARHYPGRNLITRVVGTDPETESDAYWVELQQGEFILLCSDGLVDTVSDEEMADAVLRTNEVNQCLNRMLELAKSRGAADNITAVLLRRQ